MRIMVKKAIRIIVSAEAIVTTTSLISFSFYINMQVAFASSLLVILGSSYAYKRMISNQVDAKSYEDKRDILDEIEDPHGLYDNEPINDASVDELDLKEIVKEERAKIKTFSVASMKHGVRGASSLLRLIPYLFLVLGFIALKNNEVLDITVYLPSLLLGIIVGSITSKELFST